MKTILPPCSADSLILRKNSTLRIIDTEGSQVSDVVLFDKEDKTCQFSAGKTMDFEESILMTEGNYLWSNTGIKLAHISKDTCGRNDLLLAPCCQKTFDILYEQDLGQRPGCHGQLSKALKHWNIDYNQIPTAFNVFMNVQFDERGKIKVLPPTSKAGDYLELTACRDLIVGLTACSAPQSNGGACTSISYEVI